MENYPTVDRESFQELLASAFAVQQMDSQSRSSLVEIGRSVTTGSLDVDEAVHLIVDRAQELEHRRNVAIGLLSDAQLPPALAPKDEPSTNADVTDDSCVTSPVHPPEVRTGRFQLRDPSALLLILVIAVALLLGWMLGRVTRPTTAHKKETPASVSAKPDAVTPQSGQIGQAEPSSAPPIPAKARIPEMPSDDLVVYQDGKVVFPRNTSKAQDGSSTTDSALVSAPKANGRLLKRVEPEYPEAARQQRIQGLVAFEATVGQDGEVQRLTVISGNPVLVTAASAAVLKWRFKPLVQNGRAVRFETRITVDFVLP
jgi:TonB family protein